MAAAKKTAVKKTAGTRPSKDPASKTQQRAARRTEESLTDKAKVFRDAFIREYLVDFNATHAYMRAGGKSKRPHKDGYNMRHEAYVSHQIQRAIEAMSVDKMVTHQSALSWMIREANHFGADASHGARVGAIAHLIKAHALAGAAKDGALAARGGVMIVPPTDTTDDWETRAAAAQAKLKETVRE